MSIHLIKVEPYWNVKFVIYLTLRDVPTTLIKVEPYWNVNEYNISNQS